MTQKKRHHYVPQFYLSQFTDKLNKKDHEDALWVFEKSTGKVFPKAPKNIGFVNYFYSLKMDQGISNVIEDSLSQMESDVAPVFYKIIKGQTNISNTKEKYWLARFICFLNYRTLKSDERFDVLGQNFIKDKIVKKIDRGGGFEEYIKKRNLEVTPERFLQSFNKIKILPPREIKLKVMVEGALQMILPLVQRKWQFLTPKSSKVQFITSDHPVILFNQDYTFKYFVPGIGLKNTDIIFPMSPNTCFYASQNVRKDINILNDDEVITINKRVASFSNKYLFSNSSSLFAHHENKSEVKSNR